MRFFTSKAALHRGLVLALVLIMGAGAAAAGAAGAGSMDRRSASLPDGFYPEGVAMDAAGNLYAGSLSRGSILRVPRGGDKAEPFIAPGTGGLVSVIGILADSGRNVLWACSSDPGVGERAGTAEPSLTAFRLSDGAPLAAFPLGKGAFCNDMALGPQGEVYVTDSFNPVIRRAALPANGAKGGMAVWLSDPRFVSAPRDPRDMSAPFNLNGAVFGADGALYAVKTNTGELFRIAVKEDGSAGAVETLALPRPLDGPDGLKALPDGALLVVEGADRLTRIDLTGPQVRLDPMAQGFDFATTVVPDGNGAWVTEGQLDLLFKPELAGKAPRPFKLTWVAIPQ